MSYLDIGVLGSDWPAVREAAEDELGQQHRKVDEESNKTHSVCCKPLKHSKKLGIYE